MEEQSGETERWFKELLLGSHQPEFLYDSLSFHPLGSRWEETRVDPRGLGILQALAPNDFKT